MCLLRFLTNNICFSSGMDGYTIAVADEARFFCRGYSDWPIVTRKWTEV